MNDKSVNNDKSHSADTGQKLRKRSPEEVHLQAASKNRQRWCGRDAWFYWDL